MIIPWLEMRRNPSADIDSNFQKYVLLNLYEASMVVDTNSNYIDISINVGLKPSFFTRVAQFCF